MTSPHTDPRFTQALELIARVGALIHQAERILRTADPIHIPRIDLVIRGLMQANHALAQAYNGALSNVPERAPEPPKPAPTDPASLSPVFRDVASRGHDTPEAAALREREAKIATECNRPLEL